MATMFVRHQVVDFAAWRRRYDEFAPAQRELGVQSDVVYQSADDPNDVTVTHEFATIEAAHAFAGSVDLRGAMEEAGVAGAPTVWFTNRA